MSRHEGPSILRALHRSPRADVLVRRETRPVTAVATTRARHPFLLWVAGGLATLITVLVVGSFFVDEPLRRYMEKTLNQKLQGYTVRLPGLDFHPLGFSLTLKGLTISQNAHPNPPIAEIPQLHASVHWRALLHARLVADFLFRQPKVHINRAQLQHEARDPVPLKDKGWQAALESIYPLKINRFRIQRGDLTYIDDDPRRPLHLRKFNLVAENIRNVRSPDRVYPSVVHMDGIVFDSGTIRADGHANFLAEPQAAFNTDVTLDRVELNYFKPILARANLWVTKGLLSATGHVEYAPKIQDMHLKTLTIRDVEIYYFHRPETAAAEAVRAEKVERAAQRLHDTPTAVTRVDTLHIANSIVGYANYSTKPSYTVYLTDADMTLKNFTNQKPGGPTAVSMTGAFMGSGATSVQATFRPAEDPPAFDVSVKIEGTQLRSMNDLLRAFGNFDVVAGEFDFYSELNVEKGQISGYLKPLFKDMKVYDRRQDSEKAVFHQLYEGLIEGVQTILRNRSGEVATKADLSGPASQPMTSTLQIIMRLLQNAFIKAILPGFEHDVSAARPEEPH